MAINGNILIDKLRITFPIDTLSELSTTERTYIEKVRETLEQYYPATAYSISSSRGEIKITLTPTRFKPPHNFAYTDTNLEMPSEKWLLNLLLKLGFQNRRFSETARIVWIHLTKNVIMNEQVSLYKEFLSSYPFANGYKSALISSSKNNATLRIATQKRNTERDDINGERTIIFYDKGQELRDKANLDCIDLKEPLTKEEIAILKAHDVFYNRRFRKLDLYNLNLLRCEHQYRYREKIKPLARFLNNGTNNVLTVDVLINLLAQRALYKKLNSFYVQQLKKIIFYKKPNVQEALPFDSYQRSFLDLLKNADITELKLIYKTCGLSDKLDKNLKNFYKINSCDVYTELYQKLCR